MSSRWKFGQVQFRINPSSTSSTVSQVGDNVRTLGGAVISQPTGYIETYRMTSRVYQPNARVLREIAMPNTQFIKHYKTNGSIYILNTASSRIEEYDKNFKNIRNIPISTQAYMGYVGFDVYNNNFYVFSKVSGTEEIIYKLALDGTLVNGISNRVPVGPPLGFAFVGDYLWRLTSTKMQKLNYLGSNFAEMSHIHLPNPAQTYAPDGYLGLTAVDDRYLVASLNSGEDRIIYHMDTFTGSIASAFYVEGAHFIDDIEQIDDRIIILNKTNKNIQVINGNTALLDLHKIEREIEEHGYIYVEDDIGYQTRVTIADYSKERIHGYEHMYTISMRAQITSGGVI
jgi:hypothetical protein